MSDLQDQIAELQRQNQHLINRIARLEEESAVAQSRPSAASTLPSATQAESNPRWSRRALLLGGAGAAAAAVQVTSGANPAAAAAGDPVLQGSINQAGGSPTQLISSNGGFTLGVGNTVDSTTALYAYNQGEVGSVIYAFHYNSGTGVYARSDGAEGVWGQSTTGVGVKGEAFDANDSVGVFGTSPDTGVYGEGGGTGVAGVGGRVGGFFASLEGAALGLRAGDLDSVPQAGTWQQGDIVVTTGGEVWLCTGDGRGDWRLLGSPASSGAYVPLTPTRVYDSRESGGTLIGGTQRVINVGFAVDGGRRVIPAGTRAIAANVTITGTTGSGYLSLTPGVTQVLGSSAINWTSRNQTLANGLMLTTDSLVQLKAWTVGGDCELILDVMGYFAQA